MSERRHCVRAEGESCGPCHQLRSIRGSPTGGNGLGPGYFMTELTDALVKNEKFSRWLIGSTPSRRWGDVEDLVGAAVFLASDASNFVNGHILCVDGGVTATL